MDQARLNFISNEYIPLLKSLSADAMGKWGKMSGQQMVEHVSGFFKVSTEKLVLPFVTPIEHLPKYREFLFSDAPFRENTKAPGNIVPEEPVALRKASMAEAIEELQNEIIYFVELFTTHPGKKTFHPVFGELNFEEWVLLHYKHVTHHLRQFELM